MRSRREFVQAAVLAWAPFHEWDLDKSIRWAERAWEVLAERGYGPVTAETTRPGADWYARLSADQRPLFDGFWSAFARRGDSRQKAAMVWAQLAPAPDLARVIIAAAGQEAVLPRRPDEVRKMAQGWLSERRWESYSSAPAAAPADPRGAQLRELRADLAALRALSRGDQSGNLAAPIGRLEQEIATLCPPSSPPPTSPPLPSA